ncbi:MAG TPA: menaquinone biosynthesis protein, partial [Bryobacteraceae bacterium]|nr:menaquinone biosynthesis protein [Bryobacteraceae bacterium]
MGENLFHIGAVSYLNTVPLVWGMLHGPQKSSVHLSFSIPSVCAQQVEDNTIQAGLVPVAEVARQGLEIVTGVGIACLGAVRSILLVSRAPLREIKTLAADSSSRTSVQLARVILRERYGVEPAIHPESPDLESMLAGADSALIIGDPALRIDPEKIDYECLDLGAEWHALTGLPMVFAAWAGKPGLSLKPLSEITRGSYEFGKDRLNEIVQAEYARRGITRELAGRYLGEYIRFEIGAAEQKGLDAFLELA